MMPELDGFQVMEQMKTIPETEFIPVILLTAMPADQGDLPDNPQDARSRST